MSLRFEVLLLIIFCMLATQVSRLTPLIFAQKIKLPRKIKIWLKFVPAAVISALLFQELLLENGVFLPQAKIPYLVSGVITFAIGIITRNLIISLIFGIATFSLWKLFFP
jgi:branched-subunit amino acid transport protein